MDERDREEDITKIALRDSEAIAQKSATLVGRGLHAAFQSDLRKVLEAGKALTSSRQLEESFQIISETIDRLLRPEAWSLLRTDEDKGELYFQIATGNGWDALN